MDSRLKVVADQFSILNGTRRGISRNLGVAEPTSRLGAHRSRGIIYVLAEARGNSPDTDSLYDEVIGIIRDRYYKSSGSVTGGLLRGLEEANLYLFDQNLNAPPNQRCFLGVSCVVIRGEQAYIAQIGPALTYVIHRGELRRFPDTSPWLESERLTEEELERSSCLGLRKAIEPEFGHVDTGLHVAVPHRCR